MTLEDVIDKAVFLDNEVARYEAAFPEFGLTKVQNPTPKPLTTRERDTLLTIIAALCRDAGYDYTKAAKTAGLIQNTAAALGISIGETTIENHLKKIPDALVTRMK